MFPPKLVINQCYTSNEESITVDEPELERDFLEEGKSRFKEFKSERFSGIGVWTFVSSNPYRIGRCLRIE